MNRTLLVCSGGGHLKQLHKVADRLGIPSDLQTWVTFDNALSRTLLEGREVIYVPFTGPRDIPNILRLRALAMLLLQRGRFDLALSTGSSPAVAFLPVAARLGVAAHYVESAARASGPSVSGRLVARNSRIATYTQYPAWADDRWRYAGSVLDEFEPAGAVPAPASIRRAVVSVGTQDGYQFDRLYDGLVPLLRGADVLWQTGPQDVSRWGIQGRPFVAHGELKAAIADADVVIGHCGTGVAVTALEQGKTPVLVPRLAVHREHVDDHQLQIGEEFERRGLALMRHPEQLTETVLIEAASRSARQVAAPPFQLGAAA
jgi:UDP-N-acetylglucosamine--N-acetylmuramyl-(pentapeptide) pyrophosphoryl-undecaprenol N-acetylglucosamine transferase